MTSKQEHYLSSSRPADDIQTEPVLLKRSVEKTQNEYDLLLVAVNIHF